MTILTGSNAKLFVNGVEVGGVIKSTPPETYGQRQRASIEFNGVLSKSPVIVGESPIKTITDIIALQSCSAVLHNYQREMLAKVAKNFGRTIIMSARGSQSAKHTVLLAMVAEKAQELSEQFKVISEVRNPWDLALFANQAAMEMNSFHAGLPTKEQFEKNYLQKPMIQTAEDRKNHHHGWYRKFDKPHGKRNK